MRVSPELLALPDTIDALGLGSYPDIYAGLVRINDGQQIDVYLTIPRRKSGFAP